MLGSPLEVSSNKLEQESWDHELEHEYSAMSVSPCQTFDSSRIGTDLIKRNLWTEVEL